MKNFTNKTIIGFGLGMALGVILYTYFSHGEINWIRALVTGIVGMAALWVFRKIAAGRS